jgi:ribosomal protein L34
MATKTTLKDLYSFPGFRARATLKPHSTDPEGRIVTLERRQKKRFVPAAAKRYAAFGIAELTWCGIGMPVQPASTLRLNTAGYTARTVRL